MPGNAGEWKNASNDGNKVFYAWREGFSFIECFEGCVVQIDDRIFFNVQYAGSQFPFFNQNWQLKKVFPS